MIEAHPAPRPRSHHRSHGATVLSFPQVTAPPPMLDERGYVRSIATLPGAGSSQVRHEMKRLAADVGLRKRFVPHQLRHAHACELIREGVRIDVLRRQLGHANLQVTTRYLEGISHEEVLDMAQRRRAPSVSVPDLMATLNG